MLLAYQLSGYNSGRISEFETISKETSKSQKQRERERENKKKPEQNIEELWENLKKCRIEILAVEKEKLMNKRYI